MLLLMGVHWASGRLRLSWGVPSEPFVLLLAVQVVSAVACRAADPLVNCRRRLDGRRLLLLGQLEFHVAQAVASVAAPLLMVVPALAVHAVRDHLVLVLEMSLLSS